MEHQVECTRCGKKFDKNRIIYACDSCGGLLDIKYDYKKLRISKKKLRGHGVWRYAAILPCEIEPVTIQEGWTPLYRCDRLAKSIGVRELYVKHEGMNPSGSFKDRGMTVGVTKALELGAKTVACASTGNTSASLSLYASKAGISCVVLLPSGKVALGKIAQAMMHGAKIYSVRGNFDDALRLVQELCMERKFYLLNSVNPYRLEGQKTIAFEVVEQLGWRMPDRVVLPVGNAGNISAIFKGFVEFRELGLTNGIPKMTGIQAEKSAPVTNAILHGKKEIEPVLNPETIATAIRIGNPVNAPKAINAIYSSGGTAGTVSDDEIVAAQKELARGEGIAVEPASAASIAGLRKLVSQGKIGRDERVVCVTTGHLLKDPEEILRVCEAPTEVDADIESLRRVLS